jgi:acetolactate synthase-1/2/3 large subunit
MIADYIIKFLQEKGIDHVFYLVGGGSMYLNNSIKNSGISSTAMLHEHAATVASAAYNQYHNCLKSVVVVTTGPGGTNCITGIAAAQLDSVSLLIIAGQVKTSDMVNDSGLRQSGMQELNVVKIVKSITKYSATILNASLIKLELERAIEAATLDRQGVSFLAIPLDIQNKEIEESLIFSKYTATNYEPELGCFIYEGYLDHKTEICNKINYLIKLISESNKPVILAGNGIRQSDGLEQFKKLVKLLNIPVLLTWRAIDYLDENDECNLGRPGLIGSKYANTILQESDLVISIGARLDKGQVAYDYVNFAANAKKVIVDIDYSEIAKFNSKDLNLIFHCDAKLFIDELIKKINEISEYSVVPQFEWLQYCQSLKQQYPICKKEWCENDKGINPYVFIHELSKCLNKDDIIIPDSSGSASEVTLQAFENKLGQRLFNFSALGSMGFGLSTAIGAAFATNKQKRIIAVVGDGSIQMEIYNLQTIAQHQLPIVIFVLNNSGYNSIVQTQNKFFNGNYIGCNKESGVELPEIGRLCKAYKIEYFQLNYNYFLGRSLDVIFSQQSIWKCGVVEIMIDKDFETQYKVQSKVVDGKIVSGKLEDINY